MKLLQTRTYLEVRVGHFHTAELVLHVRRNDLAWFNSNSRAHTRQIFQLLKDSILPRMFSDEIERSQARRTRVALPPELGPGGVPVVTGEKNTAASLPQKPLNKKGRKTTRKRVGKRQAELDRIEEERKKAKEKDAYYAIGTCLQLAYQLEDCKINSSATLVLHKGDDEDPDVMHFQELTKLSKRLLLWCHPYDPSAPNEVPFDGGFPRTDMIPTAELFRTPLLDDDDEADDDTTEKATKR